MSQSVGSIMLYSDPDGTSCEVAGNPSTQVTVYVLHRFHTGVTSSQFKIEQNGTNWTWIAEQPQSGTLITGTTDVGGSFVYGGCVSDPHSVVNVLYQSYGTAGVCSFLQVVPSPAALSGDIEAVDCDSGKFPAGDSKVTVNPDADCVCGNPISLRETNWSRIKALYQ